VVLVVTSLATVSCDKSTADPSKVHPRAFLDVFGTAGTKPFTEIKVIADEGLTPKSPSAGNFQTDTAIKIQAIGTQLDKGLGRIDLMVTGKDLVCEANVDPSNPGTGTGTPTNQGTVTITRASEAGKPQGIISISYFLKTYIAKGCARPSLFSVARGTFIIQLKVTNIAALSTQTPAVTLILGV
jgi:hypothetical protein